MILFNLLHDYYKLLKELPIMDTSKVDDLIRLRNQMSWTVDETTPWEALAMLIQQNFSNELALKTTIINRCYVEEQVNASWGPLQEWEKPYHKETFEKFTGGVDGLDDKYWLNLQSFVCAWCEGDESLVWMHMKVNSAIKEHFWIVLDENRPIADQVEIDVEINGIETTPSAIMQEYKSLLTEYYTGQIDHFESASNDILDKWWTEKAEWLVEAEKVDTYDSLESDFGPKLDNMTAWDIIILLNQLAWIAPVYWWVQDINELYNGVTPDWELHSGFDSGFLLVCGVLDLSVVWSWFAKLWKVAKIQKYLKIHRT